MMMMMILVLCVCAPNIILDKLLFQLLFCHGTNVCPPQQNNIWPREETTNRQKRKRCKFLLKRMMSDFPQPSVQLGERNALNISLPNDNIHPPEKNWQLPFFNVVKLNFYDIALLSLQFQITSCSGKEWYPWNCKQCKKPFPVFFSMRWVIKSDPNKKRRWGGFY